MTAVFRCDYCGTYAELAKAELAWTDVDTLTDGRVLVLPAIYCSPYCGRTATARAGAGRG